MTVILKILHFFTFQILFHIKSIAMISVFSSSHILKVLLIFLNDPKRKKDKLIQVTPPIHHYPMRISEFWLIVLVDVERKCLMISGIGG